MYVLVSKEWLHLQEFHSLFKRRTFLKAKGSLLTMAWYSAILCTWTSKNNCKGKFNGNSEKIYILLLLHEEQSWVLEWYFKVIVNITMMKFQRPSQLKKPFQKSRIFSIEGRRDNLCLTVICFSYFFCLSIKFNLFA